MASSRGGSRKHPPDCACGNCPKVGRPKQERSTNAAVAEKVLQQAKVEQLWLKIIQVEVDRLEENPAKASTSSLRETLKYLECRAHGNCVDTVNHMHDKPIKLNVNVTLSERIQMGRQRVTKR